MTARKMISVLATACLLMTLLVTTQSAKARPDKYFFTITHIADQPVHVNEMEYIRQYWRQIGIDVNIVTMEWATMVELATGPNQNKTYAEGGFDTIQDLIYTGRWGGDPDLSASFHSTGLSAYQHSNDAIGDKLLDEGASTIDPEARKEIYFAWQEHIYEQPSNLILWYNNLVEVFRPEIKGTAEACKWIYSNEPTFDTIFLEPIAGKDTFVIADAFIATDFLGIFVGGWLANFYSSSLYRAYPNGTVLPEVAESGVWSADEKTLTLKLRQDAVWSDGEPVTSKDVMYTFQTILNKAAGARLYSTLEPVIDSMEAPDDYTFVFHLKKIFPGFTSRLSSYNCAILPWHVLKDLDVTTLKDEEVNINAGVLPSLGPYKPIDKKSGEWIKYEVNPLWYGWGKLEYPAQAPFKYVIWQFIAEKTTALMAIETGTVDWVDGWYEFSDNFPDIQAHPEKYQYVLNPRWLPYSCIYPNNHHPILGNPTVRLAMSYAIPRELYCETVSHGVLVPTVLPYAKGSAWYNPNVTPDPHPLDIEKAKELMEEAGYNYDLLNPAAPPYLEYAGFLVVGLVVGAVAVVVAYRLRRPRVMPTKNA
jgi:ABC-type transport system substrate-binding protein